MIDLGVKHHFSDHIYAKEMRLPKDHFALSHKHAYSHLGILALGKAIIECDGVEAVYTAPCCIEIKAGVEHRITAIDDVTWYCIHATDEKDIDKIDEVLIEKP